MSLYLLAGVWMNGGRRMDENKQFPQLYYAVLECCLIVFNLSRAHMVRRYFLTLLQLLSAQ